MNIQEQIDYLRGFGFPDYDECADTLEALLAVAEAAEAILRVENLRKAGHQFPALEGAIANLKSIGGKE